MAYSADHGVITTGFQASSPEAICTEAFEHLRRHREERLMDLQVYGPDHIASCLLNCELLVRDLAAVAAKTLAQVFDANGEVGHGKFQVLRCKF